MYWFKGRNVAKYRRDAKSMLLELAIEQKSGVLPEPVG
jgi:hypothetical protein